VDNVILQAISDNVIGIQSGLVTQFSYISGLIIALIFAVSWRW